MNWLDLVFLGIIAVSVVISLVRGFVREVISVLVWVGAVWVSLRYAQPLSGYLTDYLASPTLRLIVAFVVLFVLTLIVGAVISYFAGVLVGRTGLTGTDRALGMVFGGLRGALIVALLVLGAGLTAIPQEHWWRDSLLATRFTPWVCAVGVAEWLDGLRQHTPMASGDGIGNETPAPAYWRDFCGRVTATAAEAGSLSVRSRSPLTYAPRVNPMATGPERVRCAA